MDLCIRYWDVNKSQAATRYFDSSFLGHATANDLQSSFNNGRPKHQFKIFRSTYQPIRDSVRKISIGYLHVAHGTFQNGHKNAKWNVNTAL